MSKLLYEFIFIEYMIMSNIFLQCTRLSAFGNEAIPYPKREFINEEDDTKSNKVLGFDALFN